MFPSPQESRQGVRQKRVMTGSDGPFVAGARLLDAGRFAQLVFTGGLRGHHDDALQLAGESHDPFHRDTNASYVVDADIYDAPEVSTSSERLIRPDRAWNITWSRLDERTLPLRRLAAGGTSAFPPAPASACGARSAPATSGGGAEPGSRPANHPGMDRSPTRRPATPVGDA
ncbi:hypothetical protein [Streptomyces misionensis]|uniref:hypothetical protein n=1 Tax=Streptomyces misionensis TaxID=67331 RepID=UPI0033FBF7CA